MHAPSARPLAVALLVAAAVATVARPAVAAPPPTAVAPPPEECIASPRPAGELAALLAASAATPVAPAAIPAGEIAPEGTVAAMSATLHAYLACVNADDRARAVSLLTDRAVSRLAATARDAAPAATPVMGADVAMAEIVLTDGARRFEDGRVGMFATLRFPGGSQPQRWFFTFARAGDGAPWLIDDVTGTAPFPLP